MTGQHQTNESTVVTWKRVRQVVCWILSIPSGFISASLFSIGASVFLGELSSSEQGASSSKSAPSLDGIVVGLIAVVVMIVLAVFAIAVLVATERSKIFKSWWLVAFIWSGLFGSAATLLTTAVSNYLVDALGGVSTWPFLAAAVVFLAVSLGLGKNLLALVIDLIKSSPTPPAGASGSQAGASQTTV